jgi:hypothetical protein
MNDSCMHTRSYVRFLRRGATTESSFEIPASSKQCIRFREIFYGEVSYDGGGFSLIDLLSGELTIHDAALRAEITVLT